MASFRILGSALYVQFCKKLEVLIGTICFHGVDIKSAFSEADPNFSNYKSLKIMERTKYFVKSIKVGIYLTRA